ncbi:hypothetical protein ACFVW1_17180 [Streptomyces olivochromogenes]|uniref:hypothetical protein n=1 Tax=Streptomyces olivochromogenes TaxID=1963 RepID=UPI0036D7C596
MSDKEQQTPPEDGGLIIVTPQESGVDILQAEEVKPEDVTTLALHYRDGVPVLVGAGGNSFPSVIQLIDGSGHVIGAYTVNQVLPQVQGRSSRVINTIAGTGSSTWQGDGKPANAATLYNPYGVCSDTEGNVYIADRYNHRVS